jgi:PAS domain S-box-containing protein
VIEPLSNLTVDHREITILLVEDQPDSPAALVNALRRPNVTLVTAASPEEAVARLPADVILLNAPAFQNDGIALLHRIRQTDAFTPILLLLPPGDSRETFLDGHRLAGIDCLSTPPDLAELYQRLEVLTTALPPRPPTAANSAAMFQAMAAATTTAIFVYQGEALRYVNPGACNMTGYSEPELLQMNFWEMLDPDIHDQIRENGRARQRGERRPARLQTRLVTKSGLIRWVEVSLTNFEYEGAPAVLGVAVDVTARKQAERLLQFEQSLAALLRATSDLESRLQTVLQTVLEAGSFDSGGIYLFEEGGQALRLVTHYGLSPEFVAAVDYLPAAAPHPALVRAGKVRYLTPETMPPDRRSLYQAEGLCFVAMIPFYSRDAVVGALNLGCHTHAVVGPLEKEFMETVAASQLGPLIVQAQAEADLRTERAHYHAILNDAPTAIVRYRPDGVIIFANQSYSDYIRLSVADILGRNIFDLVPPEGAAAFKANLAGLTPESPIATNEARLLDRQGRSRWMLWVDHAVYDEQGNLLAYQSAGEDITGRKQAEAQLAEALAWYQAFFHGSRDAVFVSDQDSRLVTVNAAAYTLTGYNEAELLAMRLADMQADIRPEAFMQLHTQVLAGTDSVVELDIRRKDGVLIPVELSSRRVKVSGEVYIRTLARDMSARRRAEFERHQFETEMTMLYEMSRDLNSATSDDELLAVLSRPAVKFGASSTALLEIVPDDTGRTENARIVAGWARDPTNSPPVGAAFRVYRKSLAPVIFLAQPAVTVPYQTLLARAALPLAARRKLEDSVNAAITLLPLPQDEQWHFLLLFTWTEVRSYRPQEQRLYRTLLDLATPVIESRSLLRTLRRERAQLAERVLERTTDLRRANAELARAARMKDEFLANMSHELRTPLNAVLGKTEILLDEVFGTLNESQQESLQLVQESGRHLLDLINDILDLAKIEAGKVTLELGPVSLQDVCDAGMRMIRQQAFKKNLHLETDFDPGVTIITADIRRLKQILVNLLSNAVKFTPDNGSVGLIVAGDTTERMVSITVWDTGIGIAPEQMGTLFQPFVQIDSSLSRSYSGTGLGLSLVARLAEMHQGEVVVESEVGQGSRFTVKLPWQPARHEITATTVERVLLVTADAEAVLTISQALLALKIDCQVHPAAEGVMDMAMGGNPDLIILDTVLPDYPGWEVLPALQAVPATQTIPIILLCHDELLERAQSVIGVDCLKKPVSEADLTDMLARLTQPAEADIPTAAPATIEPGLALNPPLILLAEDNEANIITISEYLAANGFRMRVARTGPEAVAMATRLKPDLMIMDIQLPEMDGLTAMGHIRRVAALRKRPIIALTALAMPGDRERCLAAGASEYLSKPVSLKALTAVVANLLKAAE